MVPHFIFPPFLCIRKSVKFYIKAPYFILTGFTIRKKDSFEEIIFSLDEIQETDPMMFLLAYYHTTLFALYSHVNIFNQSECSTFGYKFILIINFLIDSVLLRLY